MSLSLKRKGNSDTCAATRKSPEDTQPVTIAQNCEVPFVQATHTFKFRDTGYPTVAMRAWEERDMGSLCWEQSWFHRCTHDSENW